jgi:branched-chain amino acid transport system ATP-binding protein
MIRLDDIHTYYGDSYVLQGVSLNVPNGSIVAVLGRNGVGKTTMMRSIIGFTPPRRGHVYLGERRIDGRDAHQIAGLGVALVPQGRRIFGSLTVLENLAVAERRRQDGAAWTMQRVFELFPRLRERRSQKGRSLSGGEQQMLAMGRALVSQPRVMLMDEPTEGLSPLLVLEVARLIRQLKAESTSVLLVEQNLAFALAVADWVYIMSKGQIVHESDPASLRDDAVIKARYLGV